MTVSDIMSRDVFTVSPETSYSDLWKRIFKKHIHTIPVVNSKGVLIGIIARKDLLDRLYPKYQDVMDYLETPKDFEAMEGRIEELAPLKAKDIMSRTVIFTRESTLVMRALSRMIVRKVDQLPVLTNDDKVIGVITKGDIFYSLFKKHLNSAKNKKKKKDPGSGPG